MKINPDDIFTPQGRLGDVEKHPNLDFLMNVFNIPRAFGGVSGFGGTWNVGRHSFAAALIALYWAKFNRFGAAKRDRLVTLALVHDLHEAVTGDLLPMFKTNQIRKRFSRLQDHILATLGVKFEKALERDLKVVDLVAFLYEIRQVSPSILHPKQLALANTVAHRQAETLYTYCRTHRISKKRIQRFLQMLELV